MIPLDQFVKQLEESGILAADSFDTLKDCNSSKPSPKNTEELASELVRQKKLTEFQAEEAGQGNARSLVLGNYLLLEKIGQGGMGQVFKARHQRMDRLVAIKVLPAAMTKDVASIARFEREVKAVARISHPNIVGAYDADCASGIHFLVMELVDGSDLSVLVRKNGSFSIEKAINYIIQAAKGLEAAHSEGIVHRDIKPANLLVDKKGTVKILDMGLARLNGCPEEPLQVDLTSTGTIMGTADYMAPEQAMNTRTADARADIYALGCSLYYLLTAKTMYSGTTIMEKLVAHREQPIPSLRAARPEVPEELEAIFNKMIAKNVADRYQTMTALIADLDKCSQIKGPTAVIPGPADPANPNLRNPLNGFSLEPPRAISPTAVTTPQSSNRKTLGLFGAAMLLVAMLAAVVVSVKTRDGTLLVEVDQAGATVQVDDKDTVHVTQAGGKGTVSISVDPGKHRLKIEKDGFAVFGKDFEMKAGGKTPIKAELVPLVEKPAMVAVKPAPLPGTKTQLFFQSPGFDQWINGVSALPAEKQVVSVSKKLVELNPGFDGKLTGWRDETAPAIENDVVVSMGFFTDSVTDISPVRAFAGLTRLMCRESKVGNGQLADLSPLNGMKLEHLSVSATQVSDLSALNGMPLTDLVIQNTQVADLSPLQGMKLTYLHCAGSKVSDLSPLKGMPLMQLQIEWTQVSDLSPLKGMPLTSLHVDATHIANLSALKGMPLESITFFKTQVSDISPLQGMNLTYLRFDSTLVADISPLKDMPLKELWLDFTPERDTALLRSIKTLEGINGKPAAEFCEKVEAYRATAKRPLAYQSPGFDEWVKQTSALPVDEQVNAVSKRLVELNPGFDGKMTPTIEDEKLVRLEIVTDAVTDISPIKALVNLSHLDLHGSPERRGKLVNLMPLKGMPLTSLYIYTIQVSDLSPLGGMKLTNLLCADTLVSDLSPLKGMMLELMDCSGTHVSDISPLVGMPLKAILLNNTLVSDLSPLKGMKLTEVLVAGSYVRDLSLLKEMPLQSIALDFKPERHTELLHSIKTLEKINQTPIADFWKQVEEKQKGQKRLDESPSQSDASPK